MTLWLPADTLAALTAEQQSSDRIRAEELVDGLHEAIDAARPKLADVANPAGARRLTAAIFLVHANLLLREIRAAVGQPRLQILGLRSVYELIVVGRYLLVGKDAEDEFRRRLNDSYKKDERAAADADAAFGGVAPFLAFLLDPASPRPRSLPVLAEELDTRDSVADGYSLVKCYRLLHRHVSNNGSHANISSIKRFAKVQGDVLTIDPEPRATFEQLPVLMVAALLREFAEDVLGALGLPGNDLPADVRRPHGDDLGVGP